MRILPILALCLLLPACATIDAIFGPPVGSMTKQQITEYCITYPSDHVCREWFNGNPPKCADC